MDMLDVLRRWMKRNKLYTTASIREEKGRERDMGVRTSLSKLNEKQLKYCTTMSVLISRDKKSNNKYYLSRDLEQLRGYTFGLKDAGVLNVSDQKNVFFWFMTGDRKNK